LRESSELLLVEWEKTFVFLGASEETKFLGLKEASFELSSEAVVDINGFGLVLALGSDS